MTAMTLGSVSGPAAAGDAAALILRRAAPHLAQRLPQLASREPDFAPALLLRLLVLGIGLAPAGHLAPDALELLEDHLDMGTVLREMMPALLGRMVELLRPLGLDPGIAQLLEIGQS